MLIVDEPVGHVDLAPTFCAIAGVVPGSAMQGEPLPLGTGSRRERVITTFDSQFARVGMHLRTIYRDGMICTSYEPSTVDRGGRFPVMGALWLRGSRIPRYDGSEGELYDVRNDPEQWENLWDDPPRRRFARRSRRRPPCAPAGRTHAAPDRRRADLTIASGGGLNAGTADPRALSAPRGQQARNCYPVASASSTLAAMA